MKTEILQGEVQSKEKEPNMHNMEKNDITSKIDENCLLSSQSLQFVTGDLVNFLHFIMPLVSDSRIEVENKNLRRSHPHPSISIHATSTKDVSSGHRNASAASGSCTASADVKAAGFATANKRRAKRAHVALREHVTSSAGALAKGVVIQTKK